MYRLTLVIVVMMGSPAWASSGPFVSLRNTDFVVLIAFLLFIGVLLRLKVPSLLTGLLDKRAAEITTTLNEARALREEAQTLLASYERQQREVQEQANRIVAQAQADVAAAASQAKEDLQLSVDRRIAAAEDQIASAEAAAVKEIKDQAIKLAILVANEVLTKQMTEAVGKELIDSAIEEIDAKLH